MGVVESHKESVDIITSILGTEGIFWLVPVTWEASGSGFFRPKELNGNLLISFSCLIIKASLV